MRIDKFLKISRVLKRRTVANEACGAGKVKINGNPVKPSHEVKVGDVVTIRFGEGEMSFRVEAVKETVKKEDTASLYTIL
ncbi:MAG: RNA-binding S4 domain-containing protein [Clostridia bacterium]|nr:RNA-binding S4 domain-containing protein [Clostridia bacterium]